VNSLSKWRLLDEHHHRANLSIGEVDSVSYRGGFREDEIKVRWMRGPVSEWEDEGGRDGLSRIGKGAEWQAQSVDSLLVLIGRIPTLLFENLTDHLPIEISMDNDLGLIPAILINLISI